MSANKGVLLVNLGSPDSPAVGDVRRFLREFLMDCRVLDAPWIIRFLVVHFLILPFRPKKSDAARLLLNLGQVLDRHLLNLDHYDLQYKEIQCPEIPG